MASVLLREGHDVEIMDFAAMDPTPTEDDVRYAISKANPDIIGITTTTPTIYEALHLAELARYECPDTKIIMGGYHATFCDEELLKNYNYIDAVIRGEGEIIMKNIAGNVTDDKVNLNVDGVTYKNDGKIIRNPDAECIKDIDAIPFPARHLLPIDQYKLFNVKEIGTTMIASRGCPMQCSFCASSTLHGKNIRIRSPENVIAEMSHIKERYPKINIIAFMDDTFTLLPKWVNKLCDLMSKENVDMRWGCTARVDKMTKELMGKMKNAGCDTFFVGVESGVQKILNAVQKNANIEQTKRFFKYANDIGVRSIASLAFGFPGETKKTIDKTINFVKKLEPSYAIFSLATPYPGTPFYENMIREGLIKINDWSKYTLLNPIIETHELTLEELRNAQIKAFRNFYLRPRYILKTLRKEGAVSGILSLHIIKNVMFNEF